MGVHDIDELGGTLIAPVALAGETRDVGFRRVSGPSERGVSFYESVGRFVANSDRDARPHAVAMSALRTARAHADTLGYPAERVLALLGDEVLCLSLVVRVGSRTMATIVGWLEDEAPERGAAT